MSKIYVVENKIAAMIFNLVIALLCLASMGAYFFAPLWKVNVNYTLTAETFKMMTNGSGTSGESAGGAGSGAATGESTQTDDMMKEIEKELDANPIQAQFGIQLQTTTLLSSFAGNGEKIVADLIGYNVDSLVEQLSGTMKDVSKVAVKSATKASLKEMLKDEDGNEYQWKNEAVVNEELDKLTDALVSDNATVTSVSDAAVDAVANIYKSETGEEISEADKAKAREELVKVLQEVADENGNIDSDKLIADLLTQAMNGSQGSGENGNETGGESSGTKQEAGAQYSFAAFTAYAEGETGGSGTSSGSESGSGSGTDETADSTEQLKNALTTKINESIGDKMNTVLLALKIAGGVIIFTLFTWAYIILKIVCKSTSQNPVVKLKLPIWLGWLPFLVLYVLPTVAMRFATNAANGAAGAEAGAALSGLSVSFATCGIVSAIAALALIILWIPYHHLKSRA